MPGEPGIDRGVAGYPWLPESEQSAEWSKECDRGGVYAGHSISNTNISLRVSCRVILYYKGGGGGGVGSACNLHEDSSGRMARGLRR